MTKCTFCGSELLEGSGLLYVKKTGARKYFCSKKCEANSEYLGRQPRTTRWTQEFSETKKTKPEKEKKK